ELVDPALGDVVDDRAVRDDPDTVPADHRPELGHPAQRPGGDHDQGNAGIVEPVEHLPGPLRQLALGVEQGPVEIGGDEARRHLSGRAMTSSPSSLLPRSSVKPHLARTRMLASFDGSTLARTRAPAASAAATIAVRASVAYPTPRASSTRP